MKKCIFYSIVRENGKVIAKQQKGYTDGIFNYYSTRGTWFAIYPEVGMSIKTADKRKDAAAAANNPETLKQLERALERDNGRAAEKFNSLLAAAKGAI